VKILLDENIPHALRALLPGHDVFTVQWLGWGSIKNGELLKKADGQFDVLLTVDKGIRYQNDFKDKKIAVITVLCSGNRLENLRPFLPLIMRELNHITPGKVINISL
jgi:hypothetical protein